MYRSFLRKFKRNRVYRDIDPEDILIDSANLPGFESSRLEGRIEKPMGETTFLMLKMVLAVVVLVLASKLWVLGVRDGSQYALISENNRLSHTTVFANRGIIYDRYMRELATNAIKESETDFPGRLYAPIEGLAHVVGYLKYPSRDSKGIYYDKEYHGRDGAELVYDQVIKGVNGLKLRETDVFGKVISESVIEKPIDGGPLVLSIDARATEVLYQGIKAHAEERRFIGGAGVIMDVHTGEILAMTSYPQYDQNLMVEAWDSKAINALLADTKKPFLNRAVGGLYTPGSIVKPILAIAALNEGIISPDKKIFSAGSISIPNPYNPSNPSVFGDWKAHGWTDMREAIAVSSDVYFYSIGGGFKDQKGLGIDRIARYLQLFGLTDKTGIDLLGEVTGVIPTPEWKRDMFNGDIWRLGDTYITSIGQYGTLVTPIEAVRFVAAIANKGKFLTPTILSQSSALGQGQPKVDRTVEFSDHDWRVAHEGMRGAVTYGSSGGLNVPYVKVAAKTGTAEVGAGKRFVHSWSTGFFPYDNPKYAFVVVMERGPSTNTVGATSIMRKVVDWMSVNAPEYF
jgi:penicillin-binding protein 2